MYIICQFVLLIIIFVLYDGIIAMVLITIIACDSFHVTVVKYDYVTLNITNMTAFYCSACVFKNI